MTAITGKNNEEQRDWYAEQNVPGVAQVGYHEGNNDERGDSDKHKKCGIPTHGPVELDAHSA
jgi:hypothetical protein